MAESLERDLVALGNELGYPETPHFREWATTVPPVGVERRRRFAVLAGAVALAILVVLAIPASRDAVARLFGIGVISLNVVDELPEAALERTPSGNRVELGVAEDSVSFQLVTPVARPDAVYLDESVPGGMVSLVYEGESGIRLIVTQLLGETDAPSLQKLLSPETQVTLVDIDGADAFWIEGEPHVLLLFDRDGDVIEDSARLAGNTLLFVRDGVTVRVEGAFDLADALRVVAELSA